MVIDITATLRNHLVYMWSEQRYNFGWSWGLAMAFHANEVCKNLLILKLQTWVSGF